MQAEYNAAIIVDEVKIKAFDKVTITDKNVNLAIVALGYSSNATYTTYVKQQFSRYTVLNKKYGIGKLSDGTIHTMINDGLIKNNIPTKWGDPVLAPSMSCAWKKNFCNIGVVGAAIGLHTACAVLDVETVGLSIIAGCHVGAALVQVSGHAACLASYDDCIAE